MLRNVFGILAVVGLMALSPACGGSDDDNTTTDTIVDNDLVGADTAVDSLVDEDVTASDETGEDTQVTPDGTQEDVTVEDQTVEDQTVEDVMVEDQTVEDQTVEDQTVEDVVPDTEPGDTTDVVPDETGDPTECGYADSIKGLLNCAEGAVDVWLKDVTVTYVFANGFFLYDGSTTRGMEVYVGYNWPYAAPAVGNKIDLHVTELGNYHNQVEVTASSELAVVGSGDAEATALDLNVVGSTAVALDNESRRVKASGLTATEVALKNITVTLPGGGEFLLRVSDTGDICVGATMDLSAAVITVYDADFRVESFDTAEIVNLDTSACEAPVVMDSSNWGFEETTDDDPPADFLKGTTDFTAHNVTTPVHGGAGALDLTWTSTSNQDLFAGYYLPVVGSAFTFSVWALDNDPAGRIRLGVEFYDGSKVYLANGYMTTYSEDGANWQNLVFTGAVPAESVFARGFVRMYDVSEGWDGNATVYVDDWSLTTN